MNVMNSKLKNFFVVVPLAISLILAIIAFSSDAWYSVTVTNTYSYVNSDTNVNETYTYSFNGGYVWDYYSSQWERLVCAVLLIIAIIATLVYLIIFLNMLCVCEETPTFMYVCHNNISIGTSVAYLAVLIIFRMMINHNSETSLGYCYYLILVAAIFTIGAVVSSVFLLLNRNNGKKGTTSEMTYKSPAQPSV